MAEESKDMSISVPALPRNSNEQTLSAFCSSLTTFTESDRHNATNDAFCYICHPEKPVSFRIILYIAAGGVRNTS